MKAISEHDLHASNIAEVDLRACQDPLWGLIFAVPNGGDRNVVVGTKLKAEGVRRGVPDLVWPIARHGLHGLFLELKVKPNRPSKEQKAWERNLIAQGYMVATVYDDAEEAMNLLRWYYGGQP